MHSLVVGRFQPLHFGHIHMIEYAMSKSSSLIVGIGSGNYSNTWDNPFTANERIEMIEASVDFSIPHDFISIPDFHDRVKWITWIKENIEFDAFFSNSDYEVEIFSDEGFKVYDIPFLDRLKLNGTEIRSLIAEKRDVTPYIPPTIKAYLERINGFERIRSLSPL